jgi:MoeA C-terminal region (domain IV)
VVQPGFATSIATGAVVPRGSDAIVMVEHTYVEGQSLPVIRPVAPGAGITSAIFTFHEFVAPLLRFLGGARARKPETTTARMPLRYNSEMGRTEYLLVDLVEGPEGLAAYPLGKGSGSVTTFSQADGFLTIPSTQEFVEAGETVAVSAIGRGVAPANLVVVGSHCTGIDLLLGIMNERGFTSKRSGSDRKGDWRRSRAVNATSREFTCSTPRQTSTIAPSFPLARGSSPVTVGCWESRIVRAIGTSDASKRRRRSRPAVVRATVT